MTTSADHPPITAATERPGGAGSAVGDAVPSSLHPSGWAAAWMLAHREWVRFFRQKNRVVAAIVQPLLFWLLFGTGLRGSFESASGQDFLQFFLPGTVALIVLFTAIFATISVIEDRREGFMQAVLVAPVGRWPVLAGKVIGGAAIAWVQAVFFLVLVFAFRTAPLTPMVVPLLVLLAVVAVAMCGLGMIVAWPMDSTQGFHAIMMLGLMPMWLLSGAFFPVPAADQVGLSWGQAALGWVMRVNPLTYGVTEMRRLLYPGSPYGEAAGLFAPSPILNWTVSVGFMVATLCLAWYLMRGSKKADLVV